MSFSAFFAAVPHVQLALTEFRWVYLLPVFSLFAVLMLVPVDKWKRFAFRRKWTARAIVVVLASLFCFPLYMSGFWLLNEIPGRLGSDSPSLTRTAIKLGAYDLIWREDVLTRLSPDQRKNAACLLAVTTEEANRHQTICGNDRPCLENIPVLPKDGFVKYVIESRTHYIPVVTPVCKDVDPESLPWLKD